MLCLKRLSSTDKFARMSKKDRNQMPNAYHVMCKPIGPRCNLDCKYCFYTEKTALFEHGEDYRMSKEVLEAYIRKYIESQKVPEVNFAWQGGEPTLMGLDFFRRVVALQKRFSRGKQISNSLQTNGILLDDKWCEFLARENFLVGLSIDGNRHIHDLYRVDRRSAGSFDKVMDTIKRLQDWGVEYNTLSSVTRESARDPLGVYEFLKSTGTKYMQFIPIVEREMDERAHSIGLKLAEPPDLSAGGENVPVTPWSVRAEDYGSFLSKIFEEWVHRDVGRIFVQIFDVALGAWMGANPSLCIFSKKCGSAVAMEHNGDVYSCDHFVYPDHLLGNIETDSVEDIMSNPRVRRLGNQKWDALPKFCRECNVLFACHGGCPKNRFIRTPNGEPSLNYLCPGYKIFFNFIDPYMQMMANLLKRGRPAAEVMQMLSPEPGAPNPSLGPRS